MSRSGMFQKGDYVRFRSWDDMEAEFGNDETGSIKCKHCFTSVMQNLCGITGWITDFGQHNDYIGVFVKFTCEDSRFQGEVNCWNISFDMLEYVEAEIPDVSEDDFSSVLGLL